MSERRNPRAERRTRLSIMATLRHLAGLSRREKRDRRGGDRRTQAEPDFVRIPRPRVGYLLFIDKLNRWAISVYQKTGGFVISADEFRIESDSQSLLVQKTNGLVRRADGYSTGEALVSDDERRAIVLRALNTLRFRRRGMPAAVREPICKALELVG